MRVIELFVNNATPLRTGLGGNRQLTYLRAGKTESGEWAWPKAPSVPVTIAMESSEHGVLVSIELERYLVPWSSVQSVRFEDAVQTVFTREEAERRGFIPSTADESRASAETQRLLPPIDPPPRVVTPEEHQDVIREEMAKNADGATSKAPKGGKWRNR